jgi:hypothetical protein
MSRPPESPHLNFVYDLSDIRVDWQLLLPLNLMPHHSQEIPEIYELLRQHLGSEIDDLRFGFYKEDPNRLKDLAELLRKKPTVVLFHPDTIGVEYAASLREELDLGPEVGPGTPDSVIDMEVDDMCSIDSCDYFSSSSFADTKADQFINAHPLTFHLSLSQDVPPYHLWTPWADDITFPY